MLRVRTVVSYVDFTTLSQRALEGAVLLARSFGARVLAAAAVPIPGVNIRSHVLPDSGGGLHGVDNAEAAGVLDELVRSTPHQGVPLEPYPMSGDAPSVLLSLLARVRAEVLVVGVGGSRPLLMRMNRLQERLFRQAPCPVLTLNAAAVSQGLRAPKPRPLGERPPRILISTAFDPPSEHAVLIGLLLTRHYQADTTLLHVVSAAENPRASPFHLWQFLAGFTSRAQALLASAICPEWISPVPRTLIRSGRADETIIETTADLGADLLVIGARRPPLRVPLWPSLASRLVAAAPCAVLVAGPHALTNVSPASEWAAEANRVPA